MHEERIPCREYYKNRPASTSERVNDYSSGWIEVDELIARDHGG